jgi:prepilin-type N-terminal cleavage/methylation domain-containing protein/prepilin-type processing-associated H-X9-DG protein
MRQRHRSIGFTLVELLVVIGIIAVLMAILLPSLSRARESAGAIKCSANLRSIGQGLFIYASENKGRLPNSYEHRGNQIDPVTGLQTPNAPVAGYQHWSSWLLGTVPQEAFQCPSLTKGGLPPTFPQPGQWDAGQIGETGNDGSVVDPRVAPVTAVNGANISVTYTPDAQALRIGYTLNDGICGRNKHTVGFQSAADVRTYSFGLSADMVENPAGTILATEFIDSGRIVSGAGYSSATTVTKSHRPVTPWRAAGTGSGDPNLDGARIPLATTLRRTNRTDFYVRTDGAQSLDPLADYGAGLYTVGSTGSYMTRLDWVGRNHAKGDKYVDNKTNFLYVDGHVEQKSILETVPEDATQTTPWEWGKRMYSLNPNDPDLP